MGHTGVQAIVAAASGLLGRAEVVADRSWPHGESVVLELALGDGRRIIGKAHRQRAKFDGEVAAYRGWVAVLGDRAPALLAVDDAAHVLLLSRLDGETPTALLGGRRLVEVHRQAGSLLARLHGGSPAEPMVGYAASQRRRLADWVRRAGPGVLAADEVDIVSAALAALDDLPDPLGVRCHRDWQPRNWLVDADGILRVFDFEHWRVEPWVEDLQRLRRDEWQDHPELAAAFFDGYGRRPDEVAERWLEGLAMLGHLTTIVWADEHDDAPFAAQAREHLAAARR